MIAYIDIMSVCYTLIDSHHPVWIIPVAVVLGGITFLLPAYGVANLERYLVFHGI